MTWFTFKEIKKRDIFIIGAVALLMFIGMLLIPDNTIGVVIFLFLLGLLVGGGYAVSRYYWEYLIRSAVKEVTGRQGKLIPITIDILHEIRTSTGSRKFDIEPNLARSYGSILSHSQLKPVVYYHSIYKSFGQSGEIAGVVHAATREHLYRMNVTGSRIEIRRDGDLVAVVLADIESIVNEQNQQIGQYIYHANDTGDGAGMMELKINGTLVAFLNKEAAQNADTRPFILPVRAVTWKAEHQEWLLLCLLLEVTHFSAIARLMLLFEEKAAAEMVKKLSKEHIDTIDWSRLKDQ